jgi:predicted RNA binding protein YcfA (HicA-like mRNA interferase family)
MPKLPRISGKKVLKILISLGFQEFRKKGSHVFLVHQDKRVTTIAIHGNKEVPIGTLNSILKDIKISKEEFEKFL